jgi:hypothetical protein
MVIHPGPLVTKGRPNRCGCYAAVRKGIAMRRLAFISLSLLAFLGLASSDADQTSGRRRKQRYFRAFNDVALDLTRRFALSAALASRQD